MTRTVTVEQQIEAEVCLWHSTALLGGTDPKVTWATVCRDLEIDPNDAALRQAFVAAVEQEMRQWVRAVRADAMRAVRRALRLVRPSRTRTAGRRADGSANVSDEPTVEDNVRSWATDSVTSPPATPSIAASAGEATGHGDQLESSALEYDAVADLTSLLAPLDGATIKRILAWAQVRFGG